MFDDDFNSFEAQQELYKKYYMEQRHHNEKLGHGFDEFEIEENELQENFFPEEFDQEAEQNTYFDGMSSKADNQDATLDLDKPKLHHEYDYAQE